MSDLEKHIEYQEEVNKRTGDVLALMTQKVIDLENKVSRLIKLVYKLTEDVA